MDNNVMVKYVRINKKVLDSRVRKEEDVMSKVALLVIDMQKNCKEATSCKASFEKAIEYINEISEYFRIKKHPVIIIQDTEAGGAETEDFKCVEELIVSDNDIFVQKNYSNAFWKTELDAILKSEGVDCVVISGFDDDEIKRIQSLRSIISYEALEYFLNTDHRQLL